MKRLCSMSTAALLMVMLFIPCFTQAASPTAALQPQPGGVYKIIIKGSSNVFGYPPRMAGAAKDFAPPFFDHLVIIGDDGKYQPGLALSWDPAKDGKSLTFKLRKGVTFHDGTPFNAQAVKANLDNLIPPKANILDGITSVDVVDDYTVKVNLEKFNNLILFHFATNVATYMYSPEALKKNGADWATTHPVGTGPFMLKEYQPNISIAMVKNPNYWQKGLPYLDGLLISTVPDPTTQVMLLKSGQANSIYDAALAGAAQLREEGYLTHVASGGVVTLAMDSRSEIFSKRKVREAIEYAIDKEAICSGPGLGFNIPLYQVVPSTSPDYNKSCPPRKYDPAKAKQLLAEAGYPNGFSFKIFILDTTWKEGWVAIQGYLDKIGIKMDINYVNVANMNLIRTGGKIEKGGAAFGVFYSSSNNLYAYDLSWRSDSPTHQYVVRPAGIDELIDKAKLSRSAAEINKINQQIAKLIYDDVTVVPVWQAPRIAVTDKIVQNTGWFIYNDTDNNHMGTKTWLKK